MTVAAVFVIALFAVTALIAWKLKFEQSANGLDISVSQALTVACITFWGSLFTGVAIGLIILLVPSSWVNDPHGTLHFYTAPVAALATLVVFYFSAKGTYKHCIRKLKESNC